MRTLIVSCVAVIGGGVGTMGDLLFATASGGPWRPVIGTAGLLLGLLLGWVVAQLACPKLRHPASPKPRRRIDPERYPNQLFRRV
jgi:hypothetical protein